MDTIKEIYAKIKGFFLKNEIARLCGALFVITAVTAFLLGTVNGITAPKIAEIQIKATNDALKNLIPSAENFEEQQLVEGADDTVMSFYHAKKGSEIIGYSVKVAPSGFGGPIEMIVSFDKDGVVTGTQIVTMSETPGLGTKIVDDENFATQYLGQSELLSSIKGSAKTDTDIVAITGATISSDAMTHGVNTAISYVSANK